MMGGAPELRSCSPDQSSPASVGVRRSGAAGAQVRHGRQDAAVVVGALVELELAEDVRDVLLHRVLGDEEAVLIGVEVKKLKRYILLVNIVMIAVATAFVGIITFVGLVVPHLLRIWKGSDNRYLIIGGTLLGAVLLNAADLLARARSAGIPVIHIQHDGGSGDTLCKGTEGFDIHPAVSPQADASL